MLLVKVDSPELPIAPSGEVASRVHHQDVVAYNQVALLPNVVVCNSPVVKRGVNGFTNGLVARFIMAVEGDLGSLKLCLGLRPWLVISEAWLARRRMGNNQRKPPQLGCVEGGCRD